MEKKITSKPVADKKETQQEKKLREDHPFETESQIQNRYGKGRERSGSYGEEQARGSNH